MAYMFSNVKIYDKILAFLRQNCDFKLILMSYGKINPTFLCPFIVDYSLNLLLKIDKMLGWPRILCFSSTRLINSYIGIR